MNRTSTVFFLSAIVSVNSGTPHLNKTSGRPQNTCSRKWRKAGRAGCLWLAIPAILLLAAHGFAQGVPPLTFPTWIPVGTTSAAITVTVVSNGPGSVSSVQVLDQGAAGTEFADAGGSCSSTSFTASGQTCTESATFTPKSPGIHQGAIQLLDSAGAALGTAYVSGVGTGGLGVLSPGEVVTAAGSGEWKVVQDGPALSAGLYLPTSVALDGSGNMYIADSLHNRIRKVDTAQNIATIAGTGAASYTGDGGPAASATLNTPSGVAVDGAGNIFIADTGNNVIREIVQSTGMIRTVAGNGTQGNTGDGGPATSAELNQPLGISVDPGGNLYIADTGNNRIRRVDVYSANIADFAGSPSGAAGYSGDNGPQTAALLNGPNAVAFDIAGNVYIPDSLNNVVREVYATGGIGTFAGGGSSPLQFGPSALAAQLSGPSGVVVDAAQNVYIADTQNEAIRKVYAVSGYFTTVSEFGVTAGFFNGKIYEQSLYGPSGMAVDANGNIFFADEFNNEIREIQSNRIILDFTWEPTYVGDTSPTTTQYLENDGNAPLTLTSITPDMNAEIDTTVQNSCVTGTAIGPIAGCTIGAQFKPTTTGDPLEGNINVTADAGGSSPFDIILAGDAIPPSQTTLGLIAIPNPSVYEQSIVFQATALAPPVTGANGKTTYPGTPGGTVTFSADGTAIGTATLDSSGVATLSYSTLTVGTHLITAGYAGNNDFQASTSSPLSLVVQKMPTVTSLGASSGGGTNASAVLVATVVGSTSPTPTPTGTVTFTNGTTTLGTATLNASGVATLSPQVAAGNYAVVAAYSGDAVHSPSSSVAVTVTPIPTDFSVAVSPSTITVATGQHATVNVTVTANSGYSDTIGLGCSSLPLGVNCQFSANNVALTANGSATVQLTIDTNNPLGGGSTAMNVSPARRGLALAGIFLPFGLFFGCIIRRSRKRIPALLMGLLALVVLGPLFATGCGGLTQSSATPGTYVFEVTGVGVNSSVAHDQAVNLTITK